MTIYASFDAAQHPDGTNVAALPGFSVAGAGSAAIVAHVDHVTPSGTVACRLDAGTAAARIEIDMLPGQAFAPFLVDADNFCLLQWRAYGDGVYFAVLYHKARIAGVLSPDYRYANFNALSGLTDRVRVTALRAAGQLTFLFNGRPLASYVGALEAGPYPGGEAALVDPVTLDPALAAATAAGYCPSFLSPDDATTQAAFFRLRDNTDLVQIASVRSARADASHQKLTISGTVAGLAGAAYATVTLAGLTFQAPIVAGAFTVTTPAIDTGYENASLAIVVSVVGTSASDETAYSYFLKETPPRAPQLPGINTIDITYFAGAQVFRDLTKMMEFRGTTIQNYLRPNFMPYNGAAQAGDPPAMNDVLFSQSRAELGFSARGVPLTWYADQIYIVMPWTLDADAVGVPWLLTLPPGLDFTFSGDAGKLTYVKNRDTGRHSLTFLTTDLSGLSLILQKDAALPNGGLPTTEWADQFSCRKVGDYSSFYLSDGFVDFYRGLGARVIRDMKEMRVEEGGLIPYFNTGVPATWHTAANRPQLGDVSWCRNAEATLPFELLIERAYRTGTHLWHNFPRGAREDLVRAVCALWRDDPRTVGLKLLVEVSNEPWNNGYRCFWGYRLDGFQQGIGDPAATFGTDAGLYPDGVLPPEWDIAHAYSAGDQVSRQASLFTALVDNTGVDPHDPAHWRLAADFRYAITRANKQEALRVAAWALDELGPRSGDLELCYDWQFVGFDQEMADIFLTWGGQPACPVHMSFGGYMSDLFDYAQGSTPDSVRDAAPGQARVDAWTAAMLAAVDDTVEQLKANALLLKQRCDAHGITGHAIACYELGTNIAFQHAPGQATDQAFLDDFKTWLFGAGRGQVLAKLQGGFLDEVGGVQCFFTAYGDVLHYLDAPADYYGGFWGLVSTTGDTDHPPYTMLRNAILANGGDLFPGIDAPRRRRQQPAWY